MDKQSCETSGGKKINCLCKLKTLLFQVCGALYASEIRSAPQSDLILFCSSSNTTLQHMVDAKLNQQRFWPYVLFGKIEAACVSCTRNKLDLVYTVYTNLIMISSLPKGKRKSSPSMTSVEGHPIGVFLENEKFITVL